ncbi:MAG: MaoC family dehydratase, partial [Chromatiales bacterium]|nr:MaoC family dehydratase [Chromatiales bacterium]
MSLEATMAGLQVKIGTEIHLSDWHEVTQDQISRFADATGDHQWIHIDPERAAKESAYGTTIAHGYLTLSLYPMLRDIVSGDRPPFPGVKNVINYGLNKVRFPNAVRVGSRVRAHVELAAIEDVKGALQVT